MRRTIHAVITQGDESGYVALCDELSAVTQGATLDETAENLREATGLALEDEDLLALGLVQDPVIVVTLELEPALASA